jgi:N-acetylglucosamine malate deacetylase 1
MRILALSPHTDDIEFACGGSISRWIKEGNEVYGISFSCGTADSSEFDKASKILNLTDHKLFNYETRTFSEDRQGILEDMVLLERSIKPDIVLIPSSTDTHQDHQVIREEGFRAFKRHSLIGYEMPQNNISFQTNLFIRLSNEDIIKKIQTLHCYKSQKDRPYISENFIRGLASVRGMQAGFEFAEAYEVIRWMI